MSIPPFYHQRTTIIIALVQGVLTFSCLGANILQDVMGQYNAVILGNLNVDSADTEGRQLVVGNFNTDIGFNYTKIVQSSVKYFLYSSSRYCISMVPLR